MQLLLRKFSGSWTPLVTCWLQQLQVVHLHAATFQRRKGVSPLVTLLSWRTNLLCPLLPSPPHTLLVHIHRSELVPDKVNRNDVVGISQGFSKCSLRLAVAASLGNLGYHVRNADSLVQHIPGGTWWWSQHLVLCSPPWEPACSQAHCILRQQESNVEESAGLYAFPEFPSGAHS